MGSKNDVASTGWAPSARERKEQRRTRKLEAYAAWRQVYTLSFLVPAVPLLILALIFFELDAPLRSSHLPLPPRRRS